MRHRSVDREREKCCSVVVMSRFASECLTGSVLSLRSHKDLSQRGLQRIRFGRLGELESWLIFGNF